MTKKAILVLDMPTECTVCPLLHGSFMSATCMGARRKIDLPEENRPKWCPLEELPRLHTKEDEAAVSMLKKSGYVYCGGDQWEPPHEEPSKNGSSLISKKRTKR